jgi:MFS family permease
METKEYVDSLFRDYDETEALAEFKEELQGNLEAKIASLVKKGMGEDEAFKKASAELGDISALAEEISLKKKREVFEEMYLDIKQYMSRGRIAAYVIFGVVFAFGVIAALLAFFGARGVPAGAFAGQGFGPWRAGEYRHDLAGAFGALMPFVTAAVAGWTFLGLTQESAAAYPMKKKRAAWYAVAAGLIAFGVLLFPVTYFGAGPYEGLIGGIASLIPFALSGGGLLAFLVLSEKDRLKPWMRERVSKEMQKNFEMFSDPETAARFGMFSGAIWILALAVFLLLGFLIGFKYSWLTFVFATAGQLFMQGMMAKKRSCKL